MNIFYPKRTYLLMWLLTIYILLACASIGCGADGGKQEVTLIPETVSIKLGEQAEIGIFYNVTEGEVKTTGIGLRIHYNSKVISDLIFKDIYGEGIAGMDNAARNDVANLDNDPLTDKFVAVSWAGVEGNWPMFLEVPSLLGTMVLKAMPQDEVKSTSLNITAVVNPAGYAFHGKGAKIFLP